MLIDSKENDALLVENEARILSLDVDVLDKYEKLEKWDNFTYKQVLRVVHYEEEIMEAKALASSLQDYISS